MIRTFLIALLLPTLAWAQPSQTATPDHKPAETTQPKPEPDLRGTTQAPLAVEVVSDKKKEHEEAELVRATWDLVDWTKALAIVTGLLFLIAFVTALLAETSGRKALAASTAATNTLIKVERPYVTAGGPSPATAVPRQFHLEASNYGKTPAFVTDFDVRFAYFRDIEGRDVPARPVAPQFPYDDRLAPGDRQKEIHKIKVDPVDADVVYGAVWYLDWDHKEHRFRFILRIGNDDTHPDISRRVHPDYSEWD